MGVSIQDLIAGKQKDMAAKKSRQNTLKPQPGTHTYRIMPSWRGGDDKQFWHDFAMHFIKSNDGTTKPAAVYICSDKTFGKPCEVCEAAKKLMAVSTNDDMTKQLKDSLSAQRYLLNVQHLTGTEPGKVQIMEVGQGVFEAICGLIGEYGDITDLNEGTDIKITRTGSGLDTKYTVIPAAKSKPVPASVLTQLPNLDEFVAQENPAGETKALTAVGAIAGLLPAASGAPAKRGSHPALADLSSDADEVEYESVKPTVRAATASSAVSDADLEGLDELDDLLG
jgi:hypothetical protein